MSVADFEQVTSTAAKVLANVTPDQLDLPTPCASWKVRDLINHIVGGSFWFAATVNTGVAPTGDDDPENQNDFSAGDISASYADGRKQAIAAFGEPGALDKIVKLPFGDFPCAAFLFLATSDQLTHSWDLARATGQDSNLEPAIAAQLLEGARQSIPDAFRGPEGQAVFGPVQEAPEGATPADQLAAFLGRTV